MMPAQPKAPPTGSACFAWLKAQGWIVRRIGERVTLRVRRDAKKRILRFQSVESAYRRLGGP